MPARLLPLPLFLAGCGFLGCGFLGCGILGPADPEPVPFASLPSCESYFARTPGVYLIQDLATWRLYWYGRLSTGQRDTTSPPPVDFSTTTIIACFWGLRSGCSPCADLVERLVQDDQALEITLRALPDPGPCRMFVQPHQLIAIPKTHQRLIVRGAVPS